MNTCMNSCICPCGMVNITKKQEVELFEEHLNILSKW